MKNIFSLFFISIVMFSCNNAKEKGRFTLNGTLKNAGDQKVFLEQLFFNEKNPEVVDTGVIKNGIFTVSAIGPEEGLYRVRLEKSDAGFIFINDAKDISLTADLNDPKLEGPVFSSKANMLLKEFLLTIAGMSKSMNESETKLESLKTTKNNDSLVAAETAKITEMNSRFKTYIIKYIDSTSDPVVGMFALGYTRNIDPKELTASVSGLSKRFPEHKGVSDIVSRFNTIVTTPPPAPPSQGVTTGSMAPDITMPDTEGKPFSISQLKGKYVLVDFWASWCGPCRRENPNLVAAYNKYKNKNFTILGVSLDQDKNAWLKAIKDDNLDWKQISDLKQWSSAAVSIYGFDAIPYNVLLDPEGKVIATGLRDVALENTLQQLLK